VADRDAGRIKASVRVGALRGKGEPVRLEATPGVDVVRLHLEGGPVLRLHPQTALELLQGPEAAEPKRGRGRSGAAAAREVRVGGELPWVGTTAAAAAGATRGRGLLQRARVAFIDILTGKLVDKAADFVAGQVTRAVDNQVRAGVYRLPRHGRLERMKDQPGQRVERIEPRPGNAPILVLLHGTFVETTSTFGKLWERWPSQVQALFEHYGGAVYALDHETLGKSPFANAQVLADALPEGARLHLLSHSRGGLVGEVLARLAATPSLTERDFAFFTGEHRYQAEEMRRVHATLRGAQVERFVRVACPTRGTLLAGKRLDLYLSVLEWLLRKTGVEPLAELVSFLDAVAERRTDPALIPGIEAMMPDSALVRWLEAAPTPIASELRVIAGDLKADSIAGFFKTVFANAFYGTDNDIVVHTSSMYGGSPRVGGASYLLHRSGEAWHFSYFANPLTVRATVDGLTLPAPGQFRPTGPLSWGGVSAEGFRGRAARTAGGALARATAGAVAPPMRPLPVPPETEQALQEPALRVRVVNGNLAFVKEPLFIGHYESLVLTGTEGVVDRRIGGTMRDALRLGPGNYPEAIGTHRVFVNTRSGDNEPGEMRGRPEAAIVVGLGAEGELNAEALVKTTRQAVQTWLQRCRERTGAAASAEVRIAATLYGSGGIGVHPGIAARSIVQGVVEANRCVDANGWPRVRDLQLIELYLDRASEAWRELDQLRTAEPASGFQLDRFVEPGTGALRRPLDNGYRGADYDYVRVSGRGDGRIEFALNTRRARSELREQSTQFKLVQELIANAASAESGDVDVGRTLFQLLVPPSVEPYLRASERLVMDLDVSAAAIPWEMLDPQPPRGTQREQPWSLDCRLLRKLQLADDPGPGRRDAQAEDAALIISEPVVEREGYGELVGALEEGQLVEGLFAAHPAFGADNTHLHAQERAQSILNALHARDWRVLHIAAHGEPEDWDGKGSAGGVVLSGELFLGAHEIRAMRMVPELVFINCCHLANLRTRDKPDAKRRKFEPGAFAAGLAAELIRNGVRCIVAAGWAVADKAAHLFAEVFYRELLAGAAFGDAVAAARQAAHTRGGNTWAAYQCYGDPNWRLRVGTSDSQRPPETPAAGPAAGIASAPALALALETLAVNARWQKAPAERADLQAQVRQLEKAYGQALGHIGAVAEAYGVAYEETGLFEPAIRWFQQALDGEDASASMRAAERFGNLVARHAYGLVRPGTGKGTKAPTPARLAEVRQMALKASGHLEGLARAKPSFERLNLLASAYKRLVMIEQLMGAAMANEAVAHLARMVEVYGQAADLAKTNDKLDWFYPAQNLLAAQVRRALADPRAPAPDAALRQAIIEDLDRRAENDKAGWALVGQAEMALHGALLDRSAQGPARIAKALDGFVKLHERLPAAPVWGSVSDQLDFLLGKPAPALAAVVERVRAFAG
jgi:tetratricopeptide (TPR) repeat protein